MNPESAVILHVAVSGKKAATYLCHHKTVTAGQKLASLVKQYQSRGFSVRVGDGWFTAVTPSAQVRGYTLPLWMAQEQRGREAW